MAWQLTFTPTTFRCTALADLLMWFRFPRNWPDALLIEGAAVTLAKSVRDLGIYTMLT